MPHHRIVHITLERCGSQWVKDLLTRRAVIGPSGLCYSSVTGTLCRKGSLNVPPGTFSGPIYNMNQWDWRYWRKPGDRTLVVLRDPRDMLVSLMFAWLYSHPLDGNIQIVRRILAGLPDAGDRLTYVMGAIGPCQRMIWSWSADRDATSLLVRYEDLVQDPMDRFSQVLDWLGWNVPREDLRNALDDLSFDSRVGRQRGEQDVFSHHRRGLPGDWRTYFSRDHGRLWEELYPGLLTAAGYEEADDWWRSLPQPVSSESQAPGDHASALNDVLRRRNALLERELEQKEEMIRELAAACDERLAAVQEKEQVIRELAAACEQRLAIIRALEHSGANQMESWPPRSVERR